MLGTSLAPVRVSYPGGSRAEAWGLETSRLADGQLQALDQTTAVTLESALSAENLQVVLQNPQQAITGWILDDT